MTSRFDITGYLARVRYVGPCEASVATLAALHEAHTRCIPFENVDVRLGRPIRLDIDSLQAKLVAARRGGYCFEHNTLFAAALRALGFEVATLEARVRRPGATSVMPRTHMVLRVEVGGRSWLADVGFGGEGLLRPAPLDGPEVDEPGGAVRVASEDRVRVLQRWLHGAWSDLYAFTLDPALPVDYEVANHFTSTHPRSPFVQALTVQRATAEARHVLRSRTYTVRRGDDEQVRELRAAEVPPLVREVLGLDLPDDLLLRALGAPPP